MLVVLEGILGSGEEESFLRGNSEFAHLGSVTEVRRLRIPSSETPEAMLLGLDPEAVQLAQGPLTVAGLGWDPPERSIHFHLSLLNLDSLKTPQQALSPDEERVVRKALSKLNSKKLTVLWGEQFDHGLVWEQIASLICTAPSELTDFRSALPQGDSDEVLRRLIDDSVNILMELEFNARRIDQGLDAVNLAWPWGNGMRVSLPNLALRYGYPYQIVSRSLRLAGLAKLAGFRHSPRNQVGRGLQTRFERVAYDAGSVVVLDPWREFREKGMLDEADYVTRECGKKLIARLLDHAKEQEVPLKVILIGKDSGLTATFSGKPVEGFWPLDERSLDETKIPRMNLHEFTRGHFVG